MFKEILRAFRARSIAEELLEEFDQMLIHTGWMFEQACGVLWRTVDADQVRKPLYERDKNVNELERGIRRKILRHLTINPQSNLTGCLVFMSVSKDAERIGDYCKNVFEVGVYYTEPFRTEPYHHQLEDIQKLVQALFGKTRTAFDNADNTLAEAVISEASTIGKNCDVIVERLLHEREGLATDEAVAYSLLARHFKRVSAHLKNICTAVTSPVDMLDYLDEPGNPKKND